jgi:hypothetical protein
MRHQKLTQSQYLNYGFYWLMKTWEGPMECLQSIKYFLSIQGQDHKQKNEYYFNGFAQSIARQRLGKRVPTCNNESRVSVDEWYCSLLGNN